MTGAMFAPAAALLPLRWLGVIAGDALIVLEHLAMLPLRYLVMLTAAPTTPSTEVPPMTSTTPTRQPWIAWLQARWPTAAALAIAALLVMVTQIQTDEGVTDLSQAVLLLPLEYLVIAKLRRRRASWPVIGALFIPFAALGEQEVVDRAVVFAAVALVVLVWGTVDGQLRRPDPFRIQALAMLGFGALALVGLVVAPEVGRYVVAAAWLLHGVWDLVYFRLDTVVARSYAEFCGVLDLVVAAELVLLT